MILQQFEERNTLLQRNYQQRFSAEHTEDLLASGVVKLITGPRRAGKSVYALQLLRDKNFAYLNFDEEALFQNFDENLIFQYLLEVFPDFQYLLLDEIQNLPNWEMWVGKLYRRGVNLIVTVSNANLLSNEIATMLTGRFVQIKMFPFGYAELLDFKKISVNYDSPTEKAAMLFHLSDFMTCGGFPEIVNARSMTQNYLESLFDSVLLKDITKRFKVRSTNELYNLSNWLLANFCNQFTVNQIVEELNLGSVNTTKKFCKFLEETYLFFYLPRYNTKLKLMQKAPQKVYVVDTGFVLAKAFELTKDLGRLLENVVFMELIRRGYNTMQSLFYYRTRNDKEIDFVCRSSNRITELIQVCYDISAAKTLKREISALIEASDELSCQNLTLLTYDREQNIEEQGLKINVVPVWKWFLNLQ
ncbi:MAG: ATP-binding protein [Prevotellaceae bacterium]|nr:ATP-binding protein [Prevotellaceae bacterium]